MNTTIFALITVLVAWYHRRPVLASTTAVVFIMAAVMIPALHSSTPVLGWWLSRNTYLVWRGGW